MAYDSHELYTDKHQIPQPEITLVEVIFAIIASIMSYIIMAFWGIVIIVIIAYLYYTTRRRNTALKTSMVYPVGTDIKPDRLDDRTRLHQVYTVLHELWKERKHPEFRGFGTSQARNARSGIAVIFFHPSSKQQEDTFKHTIYARIWPGSQAIVVFLDLTFGDIQEDSSLIRCQPTPQQVAEEGRIGFVYKRATETIAVTVAHLFQARDVDGKKDPMFDFPCGVLGRLPDATDEDGMVVGTCVRASKNKEGEYAYVRLQEGVDITNEFTIPAFLHPEFKPSMEHRRYSCNGYTTNNSKSLGCADMEGDYFMCNPEITLLLACVLDGGHNLYENVILWLVPNNIVNLSSGDCGAPLLEVCDPATINVMGIYFGRLKVLSGEDSALYHNGSLNGLTARLFTPAFRLYHTLRERDGEKTACKKKVWITNQHLPLHSITWVKRIINWFSRKD